MTGFFDFFFNDRSAEWKECFRIPLSLNLYTESVNDIAIGDSYEKLQSFGRPANRKPFKQNLFIYYPLGLEVSGTDGRIHSFDFIFRTIEELLESNEAILELNKNEAKYASCELSIINKNGGCFFVNKHTTSADVERFFGAPTEKDDEDEDYLSLMYQFGKLCLDFEFGDRRLFERLHFGLW